MQTKITVFLRGLLMGACDIVPGVSGGTIAFITGIYDKLLDALHGFNINTFSLLFKGDFLGVWRAVHGSFLLPLFLGIAVSIATLATVITQLLSLYPSYVWAFFTGLILASIVVLWKMIRRKKYIYLLRLFLGGLVGVAVTSLPQLSLGDGLGSLFLAGFIAIIAMLLPGISGSYLLLIMGKYNQVLGLVTDSISALRHGDFAAIPYLSFSLFVVGIVVGLLVFSRILRWIKEHYHDQMVIVLMGFMLGALKAIRPRKETVETYIDRHGVEQALVQKNILRPNTEALYRGVGFLLLGVVIMFGVYYIVNRYSKK